MSQVKLSDNRIATWGYNANGDLILLTSTHDIIATVTAKESGKHLGSIRMGRRIVIAEQVKNTSAQAVKWVESFVKQHNEGRSGPWLILMILWNKMLD